MNDLLKQAVSLSLLGKCIAAAVGILIIHGTFRVLEETLPRRFGRSDARYKVRKLVVFSGYLFPLSFFPPTFARWVAASPFPYTLSCPVEIVLGRMSRGEALVALSHQWAYGVGFLVLALVVWRRGLVRYAAYGG